jgi:hypothetical protein
MSDSHQNNADLGKRGAKGRCHSHPSFFAGDLQSVDHIIDGGLNVPIYIGVLVPRIARAEVSPGFLDLIVLAVLRRVIILR